MQRVIHRLRHPLAALAVLGLVAAASSASAERVKAPPADSIHHALIDGLKLVKADDKDQWEKKYCSKEKLCHNENARKSLYRYNWPAMQRLLDKPGDESCLKPDGGVEVTRTDGDPAEDDEVKVFIQCHPKSMPRPFTMVKEDGAWRFGKL